MTDKLMKEICEKFNIKGIYKDYTVISTGHINTTYKVNFFRDNEIKDYIIQRINTYVFKNPIEVMNNISNVTEYIRSKIKQIKPTAKRDVLHYSTTSNGSYYYIDEENGFWRCSRFIDDSVVIDVTDNLSIIKEAGKAFGSFQKFLSDYPVDNLFIPIPHFHNTVMRFEALKNSFNNDLSGRKKQAIDVYERYLKLEDIATKIYKMQKEGRLPLRVTHNDTKCNNVLFDKKTFEHLAVIDLDTVMPGLVGFDFGDSIRYIGNASYEDEKDLSKVYLDLNKYSAYAEGFLSVVKDSLTQEEKDTMALGAITMTIECGIRFLTDFFDGDKYFKTDYKEHNLVRSRCQLKLAEDMISKYDKMKEIVYNYCN